MSKFLKLLESVLKEQDDINSDKKEKNPVEISPLQMDDTINSALPEEEDVALDVIKYKTLLKALKKAIYKSLSSDFEEQRALSNITIDTDDLKLLNKIENKLMTFLGKIETIPETE